MELLIAIAVVWFLIKFFTGESGSTPPSPPPAPKTTLTASHSLPPQRKEPTASIGAAERGARTPTHISNPSDSTLYAHVAGAPHRIGKATPVETVFHAGQTLAAEREPSNRHDSNAIKLKIGQRHIGYVPKDINEPLARHMDVGGVLEVQVTRVNADDHWLGVRISIRKS